MLKSVAAIVITAICYLLLGKLGLLLAIPPGYATAIFPAAALAVVAVLQAGNWMLVGVGLGSFALNLGIAWQQHADLAANDFLISASLAAGASLQAYLASKLVQWRIADGWQTLAQDRDIVVFLLLAGPLACFLSSTWAMVTLTLFGMIAWHELAFNWWNWWIGDALGVLLFAPMLLNVLYFKQQPWQARARGVVAPTLLLTLGIVTAFVYASDRDSKLLKYRIDGYAQSLTYVINQQLLTYNETVSALASLMTIAPELTQADFTAFTRPMFQQHSDVHALSWNPVVTADQRPNFEVRFARENAISNFHITERDADQRLIPAQSRDWYVAVGYIAPLEKNVKALGYDIASNPDRLSAIRAAMRSGEMTATPPIRLVQDSSNRSGLLILQPVYAKQAPGDNPLGFAVGVFKVEEMLARQAEKYLPNYLGVRLEDTAVTSDNRIIFSNLQPANTDLSPLFWTHTLDFAGRNWLITLYPTAKFLASERSLFAWSVLATGLVIASMLQAMLLGMTGRNYAIQRLVDQQTQEIVQKNQVLQDSEQFLRQEKEKYESLMWASGDGIHILDLDGVVVEANPKFCELLGYSHHEVIGMHVSRWEAFFDPEAAADKIRRNFDQANVFETRHRRKDGEIIDVEVSSKALQIGGKKLLWNASRDISERKRLQQELTAAKDAAEHAAALKSRFLANMSHEIRTPMNGIIGLTQLALEQPMQDDLRSMLQNTLLSAQNLLGILNDILDLSKIEAGRLVVEQQPFELSQVCTALQNLFGNRAREKGLKFEINLDPKTPSHVLGDALRLQQVLTNLISNAVKFTAHGYVIVSIKEIRSEFGKSLIQFSVADSGIGIAPEMVDKLFKPFNQLDDSASRRYGGTGLGLAISRDLVNLMGGKIDMTSQPGLGATFSFNLWLNLGRPPVMDTPPGLSAKPGNLSHILKTVGQPLAGLHLLVAEDIAINQMVIGKFLDLLDIRYTMVNNGLEVLNSLESMQFDGILMDIGMPVMDGREATRQIRQHAQWQQLPIIALSAGITEHERMQCLECGMNDFIGKPIDPEGFVATLVRHLV